MASSQAVAGQVVPVPASHGPGASGTGNSAKAKRAAGCPVSKKNVGCAQVVRRIVSDGKMLTGGLSNSPAPGGHSGMFL
jgi:hypothetical protein